MNLALGLRALGVGAALMGAAALGGEGLLRSALPAMHALFGWIADEFTVLTLGLDHEQADRVLRVQVTVARHFVVGERVFSPDARGVANASTLALQALQGPLLALWVALAWPSPSAQVLARRLAWALPAALVLALVDAPVVLAGSLWQLVCDAAGAGTASPLLLAKAFLQGGGRLALGVAAGAAAVFLDRPRAAR